MEYRWCKLPSSIYLIEFSVCAWCITSTSLSFAESYIFTYLNLSGENKKDFESCDGFGSRIQTSITHGKVDLHWMRPNFTASDHRHMMNESGNVTSTSITVSIVRCRFGMSSSTIGICQWASINLALEKADQMDEQAEPEVGRGRNGSKHMHYHFQSSIFPNAGYARSKIFSNFTFFNPTSASSNAGDRSSFITT
jgi:hypothetical protein